MTERMREAVAKAPAVTLGFWLIKILATTLGETGGDTVSMTWLGETTPEAGAAGVNGYLVGTLMFGAALLVLAALQIAARRYNAWLYWATIVASTTAGTTLADFATRSLGVGYAGGSLVLIGCVLGSLAVWRLVVGRVSISTFASRREEAFYWVTITFSQTLGTALGDWVADGPLGYGGSALVFGGALAAVAALYAATRADRAALFWAAFVLTRPLGATVGDFLDKPIARGGLEVSRPLASLFLIAAVVVLIALSPKHAGAHGRPERTSS